VLAFARRRDGGEETLLQTLSFHVIF
jgi:hypothetical protein